LANRPVFANAASLFGSTMITSALGFGYWVIAARLFPIHSVGIASAAVSAMQLLATLGIFGLGTLMIGELADAQSPKGLVAAAALIASLASLVFGAIYVALGPTLSTELGSLGDGIAGPVLFAAGVGVTGATLVLDQACIGVNRGGLQLARNCVFSLVKLLILPLGALFANGQTANVIYGAWFVGNVVSLASFWIHARRTNFKPHLKPAFRSLATIRNTALAHHWLNVAAQAPRLLLPVLVAATLSPELNAAFYTAVLIVSFASIVPAHLATALFALPSGHMDRLARELRGTLRVSIAVSVLSAVAFALVARPCLTVFGPKYVTATNAMVVLGLSTLPFTVKVHYAAVSRVRGSLTRCAWISTLGGLLELALSYLGAQRAGLTGVSAGLVLALSLEAAVLWPIIANAARVPILGFPRWLFGEAHTPVIDAGATTPWRPADAAFIHIWEYAGAIKVGPVPGRIRAAIRLVSTVLSVTVASRQVKRERVCVERSEAGRLVAALLTHRVGAKAFPRVLLSVIALPDSLDDYLRGKRRGRLRTNLNNAERAGIAVTELCDPTERLAAYVECIDDDVGTSAAGALLANPGAVVVTASDADGRALCMGAAIVDGADAYLAKLVSIRERAGASDARYSVHTALVAELIARGATRLWADGPLTVHPGLQRFQRLLGYECARPRISRLPAKQAACDLTNTTKGCADMNEPFAPKAIEPLTISVVIAAYSAERWDDLQAAVASIAAQSYAAHEIVVAVDNNPELLQRVRTHLLSVIAVENDGSPGAGGARNSGSAVATGDVLAFIDDDAQADPDWLATVASALDDAALIGVGGTITPRWLTRRPWWFPREFDWVVGCTFRGSPTRERAVRNLIAANMAIRRDCFEELDGFHLEFGKVGTRSAPEETELCIRAGKRWPDRSWWFIPAAAVHHNVPAARTKLRYFLRRCWLEGLGKAELAGLVSGAEATRDERRYAAVILPTGVLRYLWQALRLQPVALGQAVMLVVGFLYTAAGYAFGRLVARPGV